MLQAILTMASRKVVKITSYENSTQRYIVKLPDGSMRKVEARFEVLSSLTRGPHPWPLVFFPKNPSGVGFSFRTVSRESAITKPTRPGRANEEEAVYGGIAEPTGEETKGERKGSSEQTKRKPCAERTCGGIYPVKLCNSTGLGPGQGGARLHRRRCTGVRGGARRGPGQR